VYFYELHEGDQDVFSDLLLVHDEQWEPEEFFELVQRIRRSVLDAFEHDTLIEAIATELERTYGFTFVTDDKLTAAINVSRDDAENFLADLEAEPEGDEDDDEDEPQVVRADGEFRTVYADFDPNDPDRPH
jgi:hypothetical protein